MNEEWKDIPKYKGYQASTLGNIRSVDRTVISKNGVSRNLKGRLLTISISTNSYYRVTLYHGKTKSVHVLIANAFLTKPDDGKYYVVDHKDDNKLNNNLDNLQYLTIRKNSIKSAKNQTGYVGVRIADNGYNAVISIKGVITYLGNFKTALKASNAYQSKVKELINE